MRIALIIISFFVLNLMAETGSGNFMYERCVVGADKFAMESADCIDYRKLQAELKAKKPSVEKISINGTHYKNLKVEVSKNPKSYDAKSSEAAKTAQQQCVDNGFKFKSAFYFEEHGKKLYVTDVFCSNEKSNDDNARVAIMRDRKARGASLHPSAKSLMAAKNDIELTGYNTVNTGAEPDPSLSTIDPAAKAAAGK